MAGHSKFKNIQHRKGAQDKKRAKVFTRLLKEISVAVKEGGGDPEFNPRLRTAINGAKGANVPKDRIESAIEKASNPALAENYEEIRYEGFSAGGVSIIVEALTENRNRTVSDVRSTFTKLGGKFGETGSVSFNFEKIGLIVYPADVATSDEMFETILEAEASDITSEEEQHFVECKPADLAKVRDALEKKLGTAEAASLTWKPLTYHSVATPEDVEKVHKLVDTLEDLDDVDSVITNLKED